MNIKENNSFHDSLEKIAKQHLQIVDAVAKYSISEQTQLTNYIKSITPALTAIINNSAYQELLASTSRISELIKENLSPQLKDITNATYDSLSKCDFSALKTLQGSLAGIDFSHLNVDAIDFTDNGSIVYESEAYTPDEVNSSISELVFKASTGTIEFSDVKKHPKLSISLIILMYVVFNLLVPYIFSSAMQYITENYFSNKAEIAENDYSNFRIITADVLNVRRNHSTDSDVIGNLYYLNVVKVIDTAPYWLKVEYKDVTNNIQITGWICTKYTADFSQETENLQKFTN